MKKIVTLLCLIVPAMANAQDTISLGECLKATEENHPRQGDYQLLENISGNRLENFQAEWYPELNVNGSATYQSDVIQLGINSPIPGLQFPVAPKDQYKVSLDINQTLYDAGMTKKQKEVEKTNVQTSVKQLKSDINQDKDFVKNLYFNILMLQESMKITSLSIGQLDVNRSVVQSGVDNGVLLSSDMDLLRVEVMKLRQNLAELENRRQAFLKILALKTGLQITDRDSFLLTGFDIPEKADMQRTELEVFDLKREALSKSEDLLKSKRLPVLYAFGQFGYGKPGLNLLNNEFNTYYIVGAGLKWNLWDWNQVKRDRSNLQMQSDMVGHQRDNFVMNIDDAMTQQMADIHTHNDNIAKFQQILLLRESISSTYQAQLSNGTIKTSDFLQVLNAEKIARIQLASEKILLQKAIADYKFTEGTL